MNLTDLKKHPPEIAVAALKQAIAHEYRQSLYKTAKHLLGYRDITWLTHGPIIEALESDSEGVLVVVPRGCFKSSICDVSYPIWSLLKNPDDRILIDSEKYENSKNFIREIKGKLTDPDVVEVFGDFRGPQWGEGEITVKQRVKVLKEASITASGIGAGKTGQHYHQILHDDVNTHENSQTPEGRKKVIDHVRMNMSILEPGGRMVFSATRYASDDVPGWLLDSVIGDEYKPQFLRNSAGRALGLLMEPKTVEK